MAGHAQLKFVMTECSKTQIRLTGLIYKKKSGLDEREPQKAAEAQEDVQFGQISYRTGIKVDKEDSSKGQEF